MYRLKYYSDRDEFIFNQMVNRIEAIRKNSEFDFVLKDTLARVQPLWLERIAPELRRGRNVLIVAHGNSLRALVKYLDGISDEAIVELNIPTGVPLVYELDDQLKPLKKFYLGNQDAIQAAMASVANQGKAGH